MENLVTLKNYSDFCKNNTCWTCPLNINAELCGFDYCQQYITNYPEEASAIVQTTIEHPNYYLIINNNSGDKVVGFAATAVQAQEIKNKCVEMAMKENDDEEIVETSFRIVPMKLNSYFDESQKEYLL